MAKTRLFFVTDLHGSNVCFRKFINAAKFYDAQVLVLGGDITGKVITPILDNGDGTYTAVHLGNTVEAKGKEGLASITKTMGDSGAYPFVTDPRGLQQFKEQATEREKLFSRLILERLREWMKLAEERLRGSGVMCYISPGNDDIIEIDEVLNSSDYVINPEEKVVSIDDEHEMVTLGYTNHTPWHSPREVDEEVLSDKIDAMLTQVKDVKKSLFNLHVPPIDTSIDQAPKVSEELKYVTKGGQVEMTSAGSSSVRRAIERHQPLLGVHGHIHESRGVANIGRTLCANPGSEYGEGILRGFLADLDGDRVRSYLLTSG